MSIDPTTAAAEQVLEALAARDLEPEDPRVQARFVAEPELATRWQSMAAVIADLDDLGASAAAIEVAAPVRPLDAVGAIRTFRADALPRNGRRFFVLTLAAIAAAAALLLLWSPWDRREEPIDPHLGATGMVLTPKDAAWADGSPLSWTPVRRAQYYRLEIKPLREGPVLTIPSEASGSGVLTAAQWLPSLSERSRLPQQFQWRVIAIDSSDRVLVTSGWAETWR